MQLEVLVATTDEDKFNLHNKMNIKTDAIIGNQSSFNDVNTIYDNGNEIKYLTFNEKGVGLNRNNCLMRATADICLIADDDMVYFDDYEEIVLKSFYQNPYADVIIFNVESTDEFNYTIKKKHKINYFNYMRYGTVRIAFRRKSIQKNAIYFNLFFGGGAEHSAGEDVLFLTEILKKNLRVIAVPETIAKLTDERESTWFKGYNKKFFEDKGVLYYYISKKWYLLLCLQFAIRYHRKLDENISFFSMMRYMLNGIKKEKESLL